MAKSLKLQENSKNEAKENLVEMRTLDSRENVYYWENNSEIEIIRDAERTDANVYDILNDSFIRNLRPHTSGSRPGELPNVSKSKNNHCQLDTDSDDDIVVGDHRKTYLPQKKRYSKWIYTKHSQICNSPVFSPSPSFSICYTEADRLWDEFIANNPDISLPPAPESHKKRSKIQKHENAANRNDPNDSSDQSEVEDCFKKPFPVSYKTLAQIKNKRKKRKKISPTGVACFTTEIEASISQTKRKSNEIEIDNFVDEFIEASKSGTTSRCKTSQKLDEVQINSTYTVRTPMKSTRTKKKKKTPAV